MEVPLTAAFAGVTCSDADGATGPQGLEDLPLAWLSLLITDHLDAEGRLQLFQTGKALSKAVLQHEGAQLTLSTASKQSAAQQAAAQEVAAQSIKLAIKLQGQRQAVLLKPCVWPCVTSLELRKVTLPADWAHGLYNLPNLHILTFKACQFPASKPLKGSPSAANRPLPALLKCTMNKCKPMAPVIREPSRYEPALHPCHNLAAILTGSQTLTQLVSDDRSILSLLRDLPALTALQCTPEVHWLMDEEFKEILRHPRLEHVVVMMIRHIRGDLSHHPCSWKTLRLLDGLADITLAQLPLRGLEAFTLVRCIMVFPMQWTHPGDGPHVPHRQPGAVAANLRTCPCVSFKGPKKETQTSVPWQPNFQVVMADTDSGNDEYQEALKVKDRLVDASHMAAQYAQDTLLFKKCWMWYEMLPAITAMNPNIHSVCLFDCYISQEFGLLFLISLPRTIRHLHIVGDLVHKVDMLIWMLASSQAPATLETIEFWEPQDPTHDDYSSRLHQVDQMRIEEMAQERQPHVLIEWNNFNKI